MVEIIEKSIPLKIPLEENCPILFAQLPNRLRYKHFLYQVVDPDRKWAMVKPILEMAASPEHKVFQDVVSGFYAERLIFMPGVKNATTVFLNCSRETEVEGVKLGDEGFGHSAVVVHKDRRLPSTSVAEYRTDDFFGEPVSGSASVRRPGSTWSSCRSSIRGTPALRAPPSRS